MYNKEELRIIETIKKTSRRTLLHQNGKSIPVTESANIPIDIDTQRINQHLLVNDQISDGEFDLLQMKNSLFYVKVTLFPYSNLSEEFIEAVHKEIWTKILLRKEDSLQNKKNLLMKVFIKSKENTLEYTI